METIPHRADRQWQLTRLSSRDSSTPPRLAECESSLALFFPVDPVEFEYPSVEDNQILRAPSEKDDENPRPAHGLTPDEQARRKRRPRAPPEYPPLPLPRHPNTNLPGRTRRLLAHRTAGLAATADVQPTSHSSRPHLHLASAQPRMSTRTRTRTA